MNGLIEKKLQDYSQFIFSLLKLNAHMNNIGLMSMVAMRSAYNTRDRYAGINLVKVYKL